MRIYETHTRTRSIRRAGEPRAFSLARRDQKARGRICTTASEGKARPSTEGQAFGFGPRFRVLEGFNCRRVFPHLASEFGIRQPLAHDLSNKIAKAILVTHRQSVVEPQCLLVHVPKQVEGLNRNVPPSLPPCPWSCMARRIRW